jgi:hypothetical protein
MKYYAFEIHILAGDLEGLRLRSCKKRNLPKIKLYTTYNRKASP